MTRHRPWDWWSGYALSQGGGAAPLRVVTNRLYVPNEGNANTYVLASTQHVLYIDMLNSQIEVWWPNWRSTAGAAGAVAGGADEYGAGATGSAYANISYYDATTGQYTTVNMVDKTTGLAALSAADGGNFKAVATINAAKWTHLTPTISANFPSGMVYAQWRGDVAGGELFQFGGSLLNSAADLQAMLATTPTNSFASNRAHYGPCMIAARTASKAAGIIGDSIGAAYLDTPDDPYGGAGNVGRLLARRIPLINVCVPSETAADLNGLPTRSAKRKELLGFCDYVFVESGINDIVFHSRTAVQALADNVAIGATIGKPYVLTTLSPVTSPDISTPKSSTPEAERQSYNTAVRALTNKWDFASGVESGTTGAWASSTYVNDEGNTVFTHPTGVGNQHAVDNVTFDFTLIGSPAQITLVGFDISNLSTSGLNWQQPSDFTVSSWPARVGVGAVQATGGSQPSADVGGGGVWASGKSMTSAYSASGATLTAFAVITIPSLAGSPKAILGASASAGREWRIETTGLAALNAQSSAVKSSGTAKTITAGRKEIAELIEVKNATTKIQHGVNGSFEDGLASNTAYTGSLTTVLGNTNNNSDFMVGSIHELVLLNYTPTTAIRQKIEGALAVRHSTQTNLVSGHPYKTYGPTL